MAGSKNCVEFGHGPLSLILAVAPSLSLSFFLSLLVALYLFTFRG